MADVMNGSVSEKRKNYRFLLSSFTKEERQELSQAIFELGGFCFDSPRFSLTCTHIVVKKPNRGEKFLCGSAEGKWILREEFVIDSKKAQKWLDEEDYEWNNQCSYDGITQGHVSAPYRWRKVHLLTKQGPFHNWKSLIFLQDAKRRNAYARLLESGQGIVLKAKPPYSKALIKKTTHIFVEKALEDEVQCFADANIPCLSPDYIPEYILQDPKPNIQDYYISKWSPGTVADKRGISSRQVTPLFPIPESGTIPKTMTRMNFQPSYQKRQIHAVDDEEKLSPAKKPKQGKPEADVFPRWLEYQSASPMLNHLDQVCPRKTQKNQAQTSKNVSAFPLHAAEAIETYLEEDEATALTVIHSFLSSTKHPSPVLLTVIMNRLLHKASSPKLANTSYSVLKSLQVVHPPSVRSSLYYQAMCSPTLTIDRQVKLNGAAWDYMFMISRQALGLTDNQKSDLRQKGNSNILLMKFLCSVLENNFNSVMTSKEAKTEDIEKYKNTLIWKVFWPSGLVAVNCAIRDLLALTWKSANQYSQDCPVFPTLFLLQGLVSMVAACFKLADQVAIGGCFTHCASAGPRMMSLAKEMVLTCGKSHKNEDGLRTLLQTLKSPWLKVQMLDIMLSSYNDCLVPVQGKSLLPGQLSLKKICCCYFYLLPTDNTSKEDSLVGTLGSNGNSTRSSSHTAIIDPSRCTADKSSKTERNPVNKRNARGETPLHIAAMKNDPAKIQELIGAGAGVNLTDNAGWTPLHEACNHGNVKCVEELLKVRPLLYNPTQKGLTGLDIMSSPECGTSPLHDAVLNNHIDVAKVLVAAGGLPLLQARTAQGATPADLSTSKEMITYLKSMEQSLTELATESNIAERCNGTNTYDQVLGQKGSQTAKHISAEKCEEYILLLSQLLQSYMRLQSADIYDKKTEKQEALMRNHFIGLEQHLTAITLNSKLTWICKSRLENMKLL